MNKEQMKAKVLEYINRNNSVSYAELEWLFEQNQYEYKGNLESISDVCDHVVFWAGWRQEAFDMMGELIKEGFIYREPTSNFTYLIDGAGLELPIVKRAVQYKTDHWLPTVFCRGKDSNGEKVLLAQTGQKLF